MWTLYLIELEMCVLVAERQRNLFPYNKRVDILRFFFQMPYQNSCVCLQRIGSKDQRKAFHNDITSQVLLMVNVCIFKKSLALAKHLF